MNIVLDRRYPKSTYSIGNISINGRWECNSLEDCDRGLLQTMQPWEIRARKVYGETAIPKGKYRVLMDVVSPKYAAVAWYKTVCGGMVPRLENVPGFDGVLIHTGNTALDTAGCILVGENRKKGQLVDSRACFKRLYEKMLAAHKRGETITIEIK